MHQVFEFADKYRGSYSNGLKNVVCPFYCSFSGYQVNFFTFAQERIFAPFGTPIKKIRFVFFLISSASNAKLLIKRLTCSAKNDKFWCVGRMSCYGELLGCIRPQRTHPFSTTFK